jgi:hypothetical protein
LVNALEFLESENLMMATLTNLQDGELIIWVWVLVFCCLLLIFIRGHPWHSTRRESFSHLKLTCQRKLSIVRSSYCAKFSVGSLMLTIVLFDIAPQKNLKFDLVDLKSLRLHHIGWWLEQWFSIMNHMTLPKQR